MSNHYSTEAMQEISALANKIARIKTVLEHQADYGMAGTIRAIDAIVSEQV